MQNPTEVCPYQMLPTPYLIIKVYLDILGLIECFSIWVHANDDCLQRHIN